MQMLWRGAAYWLAPMACSAYFLIEPRTTCPRMAPPTMSWALSLGLLIKKIPIDLSTAGCYGHIFSKTPPSSVITPVCAKLT